MKKKILAMFLLLTIAFSLAAGCSDNKGTTPQADGANSGQTSTPDGKSASEETVRITAFLPEPRIMRQKRITQSTKI